MKRIIALILSSIMLLAVLAPLSGCSSADKQVVKLGQWLTMVNEAFGMKSYTQDEPYFSNIDKDDIYFEEVQISAEWDVISTDQEIDVTESITWEDALVSLVNAGGFTSLDSTIEEKVDCAIEKFDNSIRKYWMDREIKYSEAIVLLATAQTLWANKTFDTRVEEVKFNEGVKNFSEDKDITDNYVIEGDKTVIPENKNIDLAVGDIYILPSSKNSIGTKAFRVENITHKNGKTYITNSDDVDLYDIAEDIFLQETITPTIENTVIYDANGNPISGTVENVSQSGENGLQVVNLGSVNQGVSIQQLGSVKNSYEFKVDGWDVNLSYTLGDSLGLNVEVGKSDEKKGTSWKLGAGIKDVKITNEIDFKWFKLKSASIRVDYDTVTFFEASASKKIVNKVAAPYNNGNGMGLTNFKKTFEEGFVNGFKDSNAEGAKTIKICSIDVWSVGVARVCLDLNFVIEIDGSFKVEITNHESKGIEYKNGNIRFINESSRDVEISAEAKIEAMLGVGPALYTVGLKKSLLGVQAKFGVGAAAKVTLWLSDEENHLIDVTKESSNPASAYESMMEADITTDLDSIKRAAEAQGGTYNSTTKTEFKLSVGVCVDIAFYGIIRIGLSGNCYAADLLDGKVSISYEFVGEKNGKFLHSHVDDLEFSKLLSNAVWGSMANTAELCNKEFTPFDNAEEQVDETINQNNDTIIKGDQIVLADMYASISTGQKYYVIVQEIPKGYELSDLKIEVGDSKIASVDSSGVITGKEIGSTIITIYTSDKKFSACCALTVVDSSKVELEPLSVRRV